MQKKAKKKENACFAVEKEKNCHRSQQTDRVHPYVYLPKRKFLVGLLRSSCCVLPSTPVIAIVVQFDQTETEARNDFVTRRKIEDLIDVDRKASHA
jgi:hypothetical protein